MVKSKCSLISIIATQGAAAIFLLNQQLSSFSATLLLRDVILVSVVREAILAAARTKSSLPAV